MRIIFFILMISLEKAITSFCVKSTNFNFFYALSNCFTSFVEERAFSLVDPLWGGSGEDSESTLSGELPWTWILISSSDE